MNDTAHSSCPHDLGALAAGIPPAASAATPKTVLKAHIWARDPDDWYVDEEWCATSMFAMERFGPAAAPGPHYIIDPFCGMGRILDAAAAIGYRTLGIDSVERCGIRERHAFSQQKFPPDDDAIMCSGDIVTNPPYKNILFVLPRLIRRHMDRKAAVLLRTPWANGRVASALLETLPLARVLALSPRPSMPPGAVVVAAAEGAVDETGKKIKVGGGREDYAWYVFERGRTPVAEGGACPEFGWCRRPPKFPVRDTRSRP